MSEAFYMSKAAQRVIGEFEALPEPDRHVVALEISRRSEPESEALPLTAKQEQEVDRRLAEHDRDPGSAVPWEEVRQRLYNRFA